MRSNDEICGKLDQYVSKHNISLSSKGALSVLVQLTDIVKGKPFPLLLEDFLVGKQGQVAGLGGPKLAGILSRHGIKRCLSKEGGRTSRGSINLTRGYLDFLNTLKPTDEELDCVQDYWIEHVRNYFAAKPFVLSSERSQTVADSFLNLFKAAADRTANNPGTNYEGMVLQHLVAAKLLIVTNNQIEIHGANVADDQLDRSGDFSIGNSVIHCTTAPSDALFEKCQVNIRAGLRPIIITPERRVQSAMSRCEDLNIKKSVEVWSVEQFLSTNVHERGIFSEDGCTSFLSEIIEKYNTVIDEQETDPSLKIRYASGD